MRGGHYDVELDLGPEAFEDGSRYLQVAVGCPAGTAFTYQGELLETGAPVTGSGDVQFSLWDSASGGVQIGATVPVNGVAVDNGRFTASLDFGVAAEQDVEGAKDHPLFNRMPDYHIDDYRVSDFGSYDGFIARDGSYTTVEGRIYYINHYFDEGTRYASEAAILSNYRNAFTKIGAEVQYEDSTNVHMSLDTGGAVTWVRVNAWNGGQGISLYIVEEAAMEQFIVADADALAQEMGLAGKVAVYGIYFDTDRSVVKPESAPALVEIDTLLDRYADLKVFVVGHADSVSGVDHNMELSRRRAEAVVEILVSEYGVDRSRLAAYGVGPLSPATSNGSDDGRARNRRVELVEQ